MLTKCYIDAYVLYVPYRLLWDDWPYFITERNAGLSIPMVTDLFNQNFEKWFSGPAAGLNNTAFIRRMYNCVFDTMFSDEGLSTDDPRDGSSTAWHTNTIKNAKWRPSTFDHCAAAEFAQATDGVTAASLNTDDIREAFAADMFKKTREFYGERYVDYLAALGVNASMEMSDQPEMLGQIHANWRFHAVSNTAANATESANLGDAAGYFASTVTIDLKGKKFMPEHGLIGAYVVVKPQPAYTDGMSYPVFEKVNVEDYWTPEYEGTRVKAWQNRTFLSSGTAATADTWATPRFEDLRRGINIAANPPGGWVGAASDMYGMWITGHTTPQPYIVPSQYGVH